MSARDFIIVAIDGGAASGKSSTADALSERFQLLHVDTGSFYRAVTAELLRRRVSPVDLPAVRAALAALKLGTRVTGRRAEIEIDGRVAGDEIRSKAVNDHVSLYAALPELRQWLLAYQRAQVGVARGHGFRGLVMEGRDIGSVIFPDADFRFFLRADPAERARRRVAQGEQDTIHERDRLDSSRTVSPLTCPPGATAIDSTRLSLEEVVAAMAAPIAARLAAS
ncbi:MAG TPA: (d)CMP kinase [Opitutaceae bacterium]|nr:(d)CMP kinase [Opitutaceae bacterium]